MWFTVVLSALFVVADCEFVLPSLTVNGGGGSGCMQVGSLGSVYRAAVVCALGAQNSDKFHLKWLPWKRTWCIFVTYAASLSVYLTREDFFFE